MATPEEWKVSSESRWSWHDFGHEESARGDATRWRWLKPFPSLERQVLHKFKGYIITLFIFVSFYPTCFLCTRILQCLLTCINYESAPPKICSAGPITWSPLSHVLLASSTRSKIWKQFGAKLQLFFSCWDLYGVRILAAKKRKIDSTRYKTRFWALTLPMDPAYASYVKMSCVSCVL